MSSDWTRMIGKVALDDKLSEMHREYVEIPMTYYGERMPDLIALQVETARRVFSALNEFVELEQIPIDKGTYFEFLENKEKNEGKY